MDFEPSVDCCREVVENRIHHDDPALATTSVRLLAHLIVHEYHEGLTRSTKLMEGFQSGQLSVEETLGDWGTSLHRANAKLERLSTCLLPFYAAAAKTEDNNLWSQNIYFVMMLEQSLLLQSRMQSLTVEIETLRNSGPKAYLAKYNKGTLPYQSGYLENGGVFVFSFNYE